MKFFNVDNQYEYVDYFQSRIYKYLKKIDDINIDDLGRRRLIAIEACHSLVNMLHIDLIENFNELDHILFHHLIYLVKYIKLMSRSTINRTSINLHFSKQFRDKIYAVGINMEDDITRTYKGLYPDSALSLIHVAKYINVDQEPNDHPRFNDPTAHHKNCSVSTGFDDGGSDCECFYDLGY